MASFEEGHWGSTWVVVEIMVPSGVPIIIRHLLFRVPEKGTIILTTTQMSSAHRV